MARFLILWGSFLFSSWSTDFVKRGEMKLFVCVEKRRTVVRVPKVGLV